ncbi:class I SAM-dependent methyltransferase [Hydrogenovibrio sp. SC-1]|uniref:class I SAM-dependent methyltransferase n=1 Tax=Hydrogenovibrio sp. SC-1 TaxID=2065820 RepID=UPI000C7D185F|nr:class I SAM-dependent methyltransferase [Hydrogenovibrio sp. SC-1]PLA75230.1 class I SAM-dependent methyltransferase [Hydrogenovibrio sp. SC-1]
MNQPSLSEKWDQHYAEQPANKPVAAAWVLKQHLSELPLRGKALDLACGLGGNARLLAQCGFKVDAWDISDTALTQLNNWAAVNRLPINPMLCDFEQMLFPYQQYDVIVISRYLNRDLWPQICQALKPNGKLFFQTFLAPVQIHAPKNPAYYLQAGELQKWVDSDQAWSEFRLNIYGEGWLTESKSTHRYAWMIAQKRPSQ